MNIISLDPGGTTGIAMRVGMTSSDGGGVSTTTADTLPQLADRLAKSVRWDVVICERFVTAQRISKYGLYTVELVGAVRALCYTLGFKLVIHDPQERIAFIEDAERLLRFKRHVDHETDALAHLLAYEKMSVSTPTNPTVEIKKRLMS